MNSEKTEAEVVAKYAQEAVRVVTHTVEIDGEQVPLAVLPGKRDEFVDLRRYATHPRRRTGTLTVYDPPSFIDAVKRFATPRAVVAADVQKLNFLAYLEFHDGDAETVKARHLDFKASYTLRETEDWKRWTAQNAKPMAQVAFAQFLEDNLHNIAEPEGIVLLDITQNLHMRTNVTFKSSVRLSDGTQQLTYEENSEGATKGDLKLPTQIVLGLQPFEGAAQYRVDARLRIRAAGGTAQFWYELVRPDRVVETAFREVETKLRDGLTEQPLLWLQGSVGQ
jgi:uncharacterized protein YfdQ (DUF2303 family)